MMRNNILCMLVASMFLSMFLYACKTDIRQKEAATYGTNKIAVDETLQEPISSELQLFGMTYKDAHLKPSYMAETEIVQKIIQDSFQIGIMTRKFTDYEMTYFKQRKIIPRLTTIGFDAVAIVVNKNNPDTMINYEKILDIMRGKITKWSQISPKSTLGDINFVFDNANSSTITYLKAKSGVTELPSIASDLKSNKDVLDYVAQSPRCMAVMGMGWLSDLNQKGLEQLHKSAKIVYLSSDNPEFKNYYQPMTEQMRDRKYVFMREVFMVDCQGFSGLGMGFGAYMNGHEGQLAMLKAGLIPNGLGPRMIKITK